MTTSRRRWRFVSRARRVVGGGWVSIPLLGTAKASSSVRCDDMMRSNLYRTRHAPTFSYAFYMFVPSLYWKVIVFYWKVDCERAHV
jgi:hypothetical protein